MSFLPKELNEIALQAMKQTIDSTNNFRKHLKTAGAIEKVSDDTLNILNIRFTPDYTLDITSTDANAIELPITNSVEEVTPLKLKVKTPIIDAEELTTETVASLAKALQNAVLKAENSYILQNVVTKATNVIDGAADPVGAVEDATYNAADYVDYATGILAINPADRQKFTGHTPEYNSIRKYLDGLGVNILVSNDVTANEAYFVPVNPEAVVLGQIYAQNPKMLKDPLNMAVALGMKEKIAFVVKTPEVLSKITLV